LGFVVGPWPVYQDGYQGSDYAIATFARLDALVLTPTQGQAQAGVAVKEITPPVGEPLAGYGGRKPKSSEAVHDRLFAKALSLSNGQGTVTIVTGDILLIMPQLRDAILQRTGLARHEVYLGATHTHSGPGGYSSRWIDQLTLGAFDQAILDRLADAFAEVIRQSRSGMTPAKVHVRRIPVAPDAADEYVYNRLDRQSPPFAALYTLAVLNDSNKPMATVVIAPPHPTCYGASSRVVSADYPGVVQRLAEAERGGECLFLVGATGSMGPGERQPPGPQQAEAVGKGIWNRARPDIPLKQYSRKLTLLSETLEIDLPPQQYRLTSWLRVSPIAASYLHNRKAYVHLLRINNAVLFGMPCDYSGELTEQLATRAGGGKLFPVVTSFNGDYVGYVIPHSRYESLKYESRDMNLFGPWCGEYLNEIAQRLITRLEGPGADNPSTSPPKEK
jgi:hypothetical protein